MKGAVAGGVGAAVVMGATVALAGTGIGGVFNLGHTNTTAGSSALSLTAAVGKPTLTVSTNAQIQNLNANLLGGYTKSWLNRAGLYSNESLFGLNATETDGTVAMTAPAAGFVRVEATFIADDAF